MNLIKQILESMLRIFLINPLSDLRRFVYLIALLFFASSILFAILILAAGLFNEGLKVFLNSKFWLNFGISVLFAFLAHVFIKVNFPQKK